MTYQLPNNNNGRHNERPPRYQRAQNWNEHFVAQQNNSVQGILSEYGFSPSDARSRDPLLSIDSAANEMYDTMGIRPADRPTNNYSALDNDRGPTGKPEGTNSTNLFNMSGGNSSPWMWILIALALQGNPKPAAKPPAAAPPPPATTPPPAKPPDKPADPPAKPPDKPADPPAKPPDKPADPPAKPPEKPPEKPPTPPVTPPPEKPPEKPPAPPPDPNEQHVRAAYREIMGREADAAGLAGWLARMQGGMTVQEMRDQVYHSRENRERHIRAIFQESLGRAPGQQEIDNYQAWMADGNKTHTQLAAHVGQSGERSIFRAKQLWRAHTGSDLDHNLAQPVFGNFLPQGRNESQLDAAVRNLKTLDDTYRNMLRRGIDPAGAAAFVEQMHNGRSLADIQRQIDGSDEHRRLKIGDYYRQYLNRDPDATGLQGHLNLYAGGASHQAVADNIRWSREGRIQQDVYRALLGRWADPAGLNAWMTSGLTIEEIQNRVRQSPEYLNRPR